MIGARTHAVIGILEQFRALGEVLAVALFDAEGAPIACAGDPDASTALSTSVSRLLRETPTGNARTQLATLFEERDEFGVPPGDGPVGLFVRRVGEDWALAAAWNTDIPVDRVRLYAAEAAHRLQSVS